jgi:hypothetical protein
MGAQQEAGAMLALARMRRGLRGHLTRHSRQEEAMVERIAEKEHISVTIQQRFDARVEECRRDLAGGMTRQEAKAKHGKFVFEEAWDQ